MLVPLLLNKPNPKRLSDIDRTYMVRAFSFILCHPGMRQWTDLHALKFQKYWKIWCDNYVSQLKDSRSEIRKAFIDFCSRSDRVCPESLCVIHLANIECSDEYVEKKNESTCTYSTL